MPLQNRVTPLGALVATPARGTMYGNRGGRFHRDGQTLGTRRDFLALRRQLDATARALDQRNPERRFEILNLHRKRRLRDRAGVRSPPKMLLARQSIEVSQLLERDVDHQLD